MARPTKHGDKWRIRWLDADGKRQSEVYLRKADADRALLARLTAAEEERRGLRPRLEPGHTFADLAERWLAHRAATKRSKGDDESMLRRHLRADSVERYANAECALPSSSEEEMCGGFAVLLVTATSHHNDEFPLASVRILAEGGAQELRLVKSRVCAIDPAFPEVVSRFGENRFDGLYALPCSGGHVVIDFAKRRTEMRVFEVPRVDVVGLEPPMDELEAIARREYPFLFQAEDEQPAGLSAC